MFAAEGFATFYKGLIPVMAVISPKVALQFTGLAYFKNLLNPHLGDTEFKYMIPLIAGIGTGFIQSTALLTPFELVKVRQQTCVKGLATEMLPVGMFSWALINFI